MAKKLNFTENQNEEFYFLLFQQNEEISKMAKKLNLENSKMLNFPNVKVENYFVEIFKFCLFLYKIFSEL